MSPHRLYHWTIFHECLLEEDLHLGVGMTHGQVMCMQGNNIPVTDLAALQAAQQALNTITGGFGRRRHMLQYNKAQGMIAAALFHNVLLH